MPTKKSHRWPVILCISVVLIPASGFAPYAVAASGFKTLHKFTHNGGDRSQAGLVFDSAGNLYGTTFFGGFGRGNVFELTPKGDGTWKEITLYSFSGNDGLYPSAALVFDSAGNLYGTTNQGGDSQAGTVFELSPNGDGTWKEAVLHSFKGTDGENPSGGLVFDSAGDLYGTTANGGDSDCGGFFCGVVFELSPNGDGTWKEDVLHSFKGGDGAHPMANLIFDSAGNLYGTTTGGGTKDLGAVFELSPNQDGTWKETTLHSFKGADGAFPIADLVFDSAGNLYGTTWGGGAKDLGAVFQLRPNGDGTWRESVLHSFKGQDGDMPIGGLIFDAIGSLYGTTSSGGNTLCDGGCGTIFKLSPNSTGKWNEVVLHRFVNDPGAAPTGDLIFDVTGNLYGTTRGATSFGSVFELTP